MTADAITRMVISVIAATIGGIMNAGLLFFAIRLVSEADGEGFIVLFPTGGIAAVVVGGVLAWRQTSIAPLGWGGLVSILLLVPWFFSGIY